MFSTLMTIVRGEAARKQEKLENQHAVVILEQKIREAENSHDRAKRALASLILKERNEERQIHALKSRCEDLEERIVKALNAELEELAGEAAQHLARMENEGRLRLAARERTALSIQRLRHMIDSGNARLVDLRQGLITVKSVAAERACHDDMNGSFVGMAAMAEAESVLSRYLEQPDPLESTEILEELNSELSGEDVIVRMAEAGCGQSPTTRGEDVLARIKNSIEEETD